MTRTEHLLSEYLACCRILYRYPVQVSGSWMNIFAQDIANGIG